MAAGSTYTPIATTTLASATSTVTFSSISGSYTDLVIVISASLSALDDTYLRFNSDTGTNYSYTIMSGTGTTTVTVRDTNQTRLLIDYYGTPTTTNGQQVNIIQINNYSNTTTYKTAMVREGSALGGTDTIFGLWRSTSAITTLAFTAGASVAKNYAIGTTITIYGITAA